MANKGYDHFYLVHPSDLHTEKVVKRLKAVLVDNNKAHSADSYVPSKLAARSKTLYLTCAENDELVRKQRRERRERNSKCGYFSAENKPYATVGDLYLEAGDILLDSVIGDVKHKLKDVPRYQKLDLEDWKIPNINSSRKFHKLPAITEPLKCHSNAGLDALMERFAEVAEMRRLVLTKGTLKSYFIKTAQDDTSASRPSFNQVYSNLPLNLLRQSELNSAKTEGFDQLLHFNTTIAELRAHGSRHNTKKSSTHHEKRSSTTIQKIEPEWKIESRMHYITQKLQALNSLLSAIFNMRMKSVKRQTVLSHKRVYALLRSQVEIDDQGRPVPCKPTRFLADETPIRSESFSTQPSGSEFTSSSRIPFRFDKRISSASANTSGLRSRSNSPTSKRRKSTRQSSEFKVETWEDLARSSDKQSKSGSFASQKSSSRRKFTIQMATENSTPWMNLGVAERVIRDKKAKNYEKPQVRSAAETVNELKEDFIKLQVSFDENMKAECQRQKKNQYMFLKHKFESVKLGLHMHHWLDRMRMIAREKVEIEYRNQSTSQPCKWFTQLRTETVLALKGPMPPDVDRLLQNIRKFQFENDVSMPLAKEKLCLLVMSMPVHVLLPESMTDAIVFVLERILESLPEMFHCWLIKRKLDKVSNIDQYSDQLKAYITE